MRQARGPPSSRRSPSPAQYSSVPTQIPTPQLYQSGPTSQQSHTMPYSAGTSQDEHADLLPHHHRPGETTQGVATGSIGSAYGPYPHPASDESGYRSTYNPNRFSNMSNASGFSDTAPTPAPRTPQPQPPAPKTNTVPAYLWDTKDPDLDDFLHNPDPVRDAILDKQWRVFSARGWGNFLLIFILTFGLIILFAGYPIIDWYRYTHPTGPGYNLGGINGTGQIPDLAIPRLIDLDTPSEVYNRKGFDGHDYVLVFSDEFNVDGRTFYEGDDPYWEAVDLHYWLTGDLEWYRQDAITTYDGNLVITMTEEPINGMNFKSGMLQSWNKFCFTTGYLEVRLSLPGSENVPGFWPAVWTMGNLGRIGHGATTEGLWPYSYDACDVGTFPNQTRKDGTPQAAQGLSYLPGQRLSACTCPGSDHPGPSVNKGRSSPEIDLIEANINLTRWKGEASQSMQAGPYNAGYQFYEDLCTIHTPEETSFNSYKGGVYQQAISCHTQINDGPYDGQKFGVFGVEYWSDPNDRDSGFITWAKDGKPSWTLPAAAIGPDPVAEIDRRLVSEEPMSIAINFGIAPSFQLQDFKNLKFPSRFYIDYIRLYQRVGHENIGCDPESHPTKDYIDRHINAYTNPNLTIWSQAGYTFPRNSLYDGC
ncbi:hypothetical protein FRC03_011003 [Tulasnella sp. 419]|nr:hypothetical protein FRC02_001973 [Tulasnella sp. 418]KAG8966932.1 hypothetical protein FRC03_011003 [Tulasnella sp. 419]